MTRRVQMSAGSGNRAISLAQEIPMGKRAYLGNIPFDTVDDDIREFLRPYELTEINVVHDRSTGRSRGFAFVDFKTPDEMNKAIASHNGRDLGGRKILVSEAAPKPPRGNSRH